MNLNPAVAWKATDNIAIGERRELPEASTATFTSNVNYSAALLSAAPAQRHCSRRPNCGTHRAGHGGPRRATPRSTGSDYAWGWNLGVLLDIDKASRIGAQYRSAIKYSSVRQRGIHESHAAGDLGSHRPIFVAGHPGRGHQQQAHPELGHHIRISSFPRSSTFRTSATSASSGT